MRHTGSFEPLVFKPYTSSYIVPAFHLQLHSSVLINWLNQIL
jgi:hypothetical protein